MLNSVKLLLSIWPTFAAKEQYDDRLGLSNIYLSHGDLDPPFDPNVHHYSVRLKHPVDQIAITPKVPQFIPGLGSPLVTVDWTNYRSGRIESSSMAIRKQIDLPDDGEQLTAVIKVQDPTSPLSVRKYLIDVVQAQGKLSILKEIDGVDDNNYGIIVNPFVNEDDSIYSVYVKPDADWVKLKFTCSGGSHVYVDGHSVKNGDTYKIDREKYHHMQALEVVCSKGSYFLGTDVNRSYIVRVMSDWKTIPVPKLVLNNSGRECIFNSKARKGKGEFVCADPRDRKRKAQITGSIEKSIRYSIESPDGNTEVRVLDGISTIPFSFRQDLWVIAKAGRYEERWPLRFEGGHWPTIMRMCGWILAVVLGLLVFCLFVLLLASSIAGIGHPFGATEVLTTSTLLIQYLCYTVYLRGSNVLTDLVDPLRFFTLFWPLPWPMSDPAGIHHTIRNGSNRGISLWGSSILGDASDVRNGFGAVFWATIFITFMLLAHLCFIVHFYLRKGSTFPHRLRLGNWESMLMHWVCFPLCTGSSLVLFHPNTSLLWKCLAGTVFLLYFTWLVAVFAKIYSDIKRCKVTWVWHTSSREDGILESNAGYWSDVVCDQMTTSPVNRSFFGKLFNWRWIASVADIEPRNIHPKILNVKNNDTFAPYDYYAGAYHGSDVPIGKIPQVVDIVRARTVGRVGQISPGHRLTAGLLRTNWIDLLMTYQSVVAVHDQVNMDTGRNVSMPLTVKTHQLAGPLTNGSNAYFYDGCRIPFARIGDNIFRVFLGLFVGLALASTRHSVDSIAFACICGLSSCAVAYLSYTRPYSRHLENWLSLCVVATIALTSFIFFILSFLRRNPVFFTNTIMIGITILCFALSIYAVIVIVSVVSAIMCPPLDETRFLEGLCNSVVTISNHSLSNPWAVDVPAHSKYNCRVLKASCSSNSAGHVAVSMYPSGEEPSLEFSVQEITNACRTGQLPAPCLSLSAPCFEHSALGYRHVNIYDRNNILSEVTDFLRGDRATRGMANEVARQLYDQVTRNSRGRTILLVTVVPGNMSGPSQH